MSIYQNIMLKIMLIPKFRFFGNKDVVRIGEAKPHAPGTTKLNHHIHETYEIARYLDTQGMFTYI